MDKRELSTAFQLLDSADIAVVNQFVENLRLYERDSWVVDNLINYYMNTQSQKAADLIAKARNGHDKVIFRRLHNGFSDQSSRKCTLKLLLYIISKKPPWLYKILDEPILKDVFSCLKGEMNISMLLDALYSTIMLLPVVPDGMVKYFDEMFDKLIRLMQLSFYNKEGLPKEYILHLNVGVYSFFARLYGMYPWHFIVTLHSYYVKQKFHIDFYRRVIEPLLSTVKLNPGLITSTRESEIRGEQWKSKAMHDIVAECASLSLDLTESTKDYDCRCPVLANQNMDKKTKAAPSQDQTSSVPAPVSSEEVSAPIELAKDSLVSEAVNSTFFSPSDRLGLSTPPVGEPMTPVATVGTHFSFPTVSQGAAQQNSGQMKTPHNSSHNTPSLYTPTQYTPKNTPTTDSGGASSRSRHTSGTKVLCLSRVSVDESIPPSPLRKEFTAEPPIDVPKISACAETNVVNTATLSVSNLPHILEKISDTASSKTHDTDTTSNNSEDEEVESITQSQPIDLETVQSVAEFMKTVNRIRFISMTTADNEVDKGLRRADSCPPFSEDTHGESHEESAEAQFERSTSNQTTSSTEQMLSKDSPGATAELSSSSQQRSEEEPLSADLACLGPSCVYSISSADRISSTMCTDSGAGSMLDSHILLLNERLKLGSAVHRQLQDKPRQHDVNWTHFGVSVPTDEASIARGELVLLHTQLLYERQKRELHAERNRRMLSKIAKAQKVKENNKTLEELLARSRDDIFNLQTTIRLQNNEIHRMKEEKSRSDTSREEELTSLIKENERLKYSNEELKREFKAKAEEFDLKSQELQASIGRYDVLEREYTEVYQANMKYRLYEEEVTRMRKELLLMGEVQLKYQEKLSAIKYDNHLAVAYSDQETKYIADITKLNESLQKHAELIQMKQSQIELLSSKVKDKDTVIQEQHKRIVAMQGEHACRLKAAEEKFNMAQSARQALEIQMMSLYDQVGRLSVPDSPKERSNRTNSTTVCSSA